MKTITATFFGLLLVCISVTITGCSAEQSLANKLEGVWLHEGPAPSLGVDEEWVLVRQFIAEPKLIISGGGKPGGKVNVGTPRSWMFDSIDGVRATITILPRPDGTGLGRDKLELLNDDKLRIDEIVFTRQEAGSKYDLYQKIE